MSLVIPSMQMAVYLKSEKEKEALLLGRSNGFWRQDEEEEGSSESSSIGAGSSSTSTAEEEEEEDPSDGGDDEAESKPNKDDPLASLDSLEESLPIKRGLSNYFSGKSKSFACLSDAASGSAKDLVKAENPFNKRKRILMAAKKSWRRASCSALHASLLSLDHAVAEEEEDERGGGGLSFPLAPLSQDNYSHETKIKKAPRSLSLSDLQHG